MSQPIFSFDARKGQLIDQVTGSALTNSDVLIKRTDLGLSGSFDSSVLVMQDPVTFYRQSSSLELVFRYTSGVNSDEIMLGNLKSNHAHLGKKNTNFAGESNTNGSFLFSIPFSNINLNKWYHLVMIADSGTVNTYLDNVLIDTQTPSDDWTFQYIGADNPASGLYHIGNIQSVSAYDAAITDYERSKLYEDFIAFRDGKKNYVETKRDFYYAKPDSLNEDGLVASYNFQPSEVGVLVNTQGNPTYNATINGPLSTLEGMASDGIDDFVALPNNTMPSSGAFSIAVCFTPKSITKNNNSIFGSGGTTNYLRLNNNVLQYRYKSGSFDVTVSNNILLNKKYTFVVTFNGTTSYTYLDGVLVNTINDSLVANGATGQRLFDALNGFWGAFEITSFKTYNRSLSLQEVKDYHNKWANEIYYRNNFEYEAADGITTDSPDMIKGTGTYVTKTQERVDTSDIIVNGGFDTDADWVKDSAFITISGGKANWLAGSTVNTGIRQGGLTIGKRYRLTIEVIDYTVGELDIYSGGYFGLGANSVGTFSVDFTCADTILKIFARVKFTGSIDNVSLSEVQQLPEKTNYRECAVAGTEAFVSEQAYGTWEFDIYKGLSTNIISFFFINSLSELLETAYNFLVFNNGGIYLQEYSSGVFLGNRFHTAASYINNNTWYRIKITRTTDGEFTVWIKGGSFGDVYTLVDTTGGSGSNPAVDNTYTTSKYSVLDLDIGDRVANLIYRKGVAQ